MATGEDVLDAFSVALSTDRSTVSRAASRARIAVFRSALSFCSSGGAGAAAGAGAGASAEYARRWRGRLW